MEPRRNPLSSVTLVFADAAARLRGRQCVVQLQIEGEEQESERRAEEARVCAGASRLERPNRTALADLRKRFQRLGSRSISRCSSAVSFSLACRHSRT